MACRIVKGVDAACCADAENCEANSIVMAVKHEMNSGLLCIRYIVTLFVDIGIRNHDSLSTFDFRSVTVLTDQNDCQGLKVFAEEGFENIVQQVAAIERQLEIDDL